MLDTFGLVIKPSMVGNVVDGIYYTESKVQSMKGRYEDWL